MLNGQYFREAMRLSSEQTSVIYLLTYVYIQFHYSQVVVALWTSLSLLFSFVSLAQTHYSTVNNLVTLFSLCPGMQ